MNVIKENEKDSIRKTVLEKRNKLSREEREKSEVLLTERILGHQWFYLADTILCFANYGSEINTEHIWQEGLRLGKKVYMPKVTDASNAKMDFYRIFGKEDLRPGYQNIPEPDGSSEKYDYDPNNMNNVLMIMPGVAFDQYKNRIGYGKGFYDHYLSSRPGLQIKTIAIGFKCQMVENRIPSRQEDVPPYQVICM